MSMPYLRTSPARVLASALARLQSLYVDNFVRWGPVEQRLVKRFQSVTSLAVGNIDSMKSRDLPDLLYSLPNVDKLNLSPLSYPLRELPSIREAGSMLRQRLPEDGSPRKLKELQLCEADLSIDYLMWLTGPAFDLSNLDEFDISESWSDFSLDQPSDHDFSWHDELFRLIGGRVRYLTLSAPDPTNYEELSNLDILILDNPRDFLAAHLIKSQVLKNFTALKTISFDYEDSYDLLALLVCSSLSLLKTLSPSSGLCNIVLAAGLNAVTWSRFHEVCEIAEWQLLDELLSGDTFPSLSVVMFTIYLVGPVNYDALAGISPSPGEVATVVIRRCLPRTVSKGLLRLRVGFRESN